jgi:hypothetical protein
MPKLAILTSSWDDFMDNSVSSLFTPCGMKIKNYGMTYIEENLVNMMSSAQEF